MLEELLDHCLFQMYRLIAAVFDLDRNCLSTCCSAPILVLANNDAPNGPACINLDLAIADSWEGWPKAEMDGDFGLQHPRNMSTDSAQQDHYRLESAGPSGVDFCPPLPLATHPSLGADCSRFIATECLHCKQ